MPLASTFGRSHRGTVRESDSCLTLLANLLPDIFIVRVVPRLFLLRNISSHFVMSFERTRFAMCAAKSISISRSRSERELSERCVRFAVLIARMRQVAISNVARF